VWLCVYVNVIEVYFGNVVHSEAGDQDSLLVHASTHQWPYEVIETLSNTFVVMEYVKSVELFDYIVEKG
jgi:hypothetical protein